MTAFTNRRQIRITALVVLMSWLFAMTAAWANACVLQDRGTHRHSAIVESERPVAKVWAGHLGAAPNHDADGLGKPGKASCLKVCNDQSQSLVKWASSVDVADIGMAPPPTVASDMLAASSLPSVRLADGPQSARASLPLRMRYSRLTL